MQRIFLHGVESLPRPVQQTRFEFWSHNEERKKGREEAENAFHVRGRGLWRYLFLVLVFINIESEVALFNIIKVEKGIGLLIQLAFSQ